MHPPAYQPAYVGAGSNLGEPAMQLHRAFAALDSLPDTRLVARSALYRNPPMGPRGQPDFVNAVAALLTRLPPGELLDALQAVERASGRRRDGTRWGPRTLDLDLLLYGRMVLDGPALRLPHPGLRERAFVLRPLSELAPWLQLPDGTPVTELAVVVGDGGLVRVEG